MTETHAKLQDAATQMLIALDKSSDLQVVRSCINSYISLARSVTFVMQRESAGNERLCAWYSERMDVLKKDPLLRFFNELRVYSIHRGVVTPRQVKTEVSRLVYKGIEMPPGAVMTAVYFEDVDRYIPGDNGNVFRLCEQYFLVLKQLVSDWTAERCALGLSSGAA